MDLATVAIEFVVAIGSGLSGAGVFIWRVSAWKTSIEKKVDAIEDTQKDQKKDIDENKNEMEGVARELQDFAGDQHRQWQEMNRSLGQLEGAMGAPPPNPRRSRS